VPLPLTRADKKRIAWAVAHRVNKDVRNRHVGADTAKVWMAQGYAAGLEAALWHN